MIVARSLGLEEPMYRKAKREGSCNWEPTGHRALSTVRPTGAPTPETASLPVVSALAGRGGRPTTGDRGKS